ncbi:inositol phosphate phosphatase SopB [Succinimonas amylolytica]|uniref:inositol phosphate phosphatase SopB n=1 Tax=Succinimonas amylolytica TaxID=83769 RepID=UPI00037A6EC2|nr:inositol phosphate phosphatase SopB [Succinimonas amylolytica]
MTDVSLVNRQVPNFLDNIPDQNANASGKTKVMLDADGRITESNESRGHIFGKAINQTLTEKTQVSVNILRNALVRDIGAKGLEIFSRFISAKNISGKKRLTLDNLRNIKNAVNEYKHSLAASANSIINSNKMLDLSQIKKLGHKNSYYGSDQADILTSLNKFMSPCKTHMLIRGEITAVRNLINGIPKDFTASAIKGDRAFDNLEKILNDTKEKLNLCKNKLDTLLENVTNKVGGFSDAIPDDATKLNVVIQNIKTRINTIINGLDAKIRDCQVARSNDGNIYGNFKNGFNAKIKAVTDTVNQAIANITIARNDSNDRAFIDKCNTALEKLRHIKNTYEGHSNRLEGYHLQDGDSVPKSFLELFKSMGKDAGKQIKDIAGKLHIQGFAPDKNCVMTRFAQIMGAQDVWRQEISRDLSLAVNGNEQKNFRCKLTPAKLMNPALYGPGVNGNPSTALQSPDLTNCFRSEISDEHGKKLFSGYRHGILDSIKVKDDTTRQHNAENKARQLLTTIVNDRFANQIGTATRDHPLEINLTSVNLVNPISVPSFDEKTMALKQMHALESLTRSENGQPGPIRLMINNTEVWVKVNLRTFISPCNKYSHGTFGKFVWDNANSIGKNSESFTKMFGPDFMNRNSSPDRLKSREPFEQQYTEFTQLISADSDLGKYLRKNLSLAEKKKVFVLAHEINILMQNNNFRNKNIDAFELPARLALLNDMIGNVCCYNCKSGKDRTGHMDIITKQLAVKLTRLEDDNLTPNEYLTNSSSVMRVLSGQTYSTTNDIQNFDQLVKHSGNLEVHQMNTGLKGSKVNSLPGVINHLGGKELFKFYAGASEYVKS